MLNSLSQDDTFGGEPNRSEAVKPRKGSRRAEPVPVPNDGGRRSRWRDDEGDHDVEWDSVPPHAHN